MSGVTETLLPDEPAFDMAVNIFAYEPGGFLTGPSRGRPLDIALNFLRGNADTFGLDARGTSRLPWSRQPTLCRTA